MSNEELIVKDTEIKTQWNTGVDQMKIKQYGFAFTAFTKILKERYEYCQLQEKKNESLFEPALAGFFLTMKLPGNVVNRYYYQCIQVFEGDSREHVDTLIDLYDRSIETRFDRRQNKLNFNYFEHWKRHHNLFKEAIKKRDKNKYHLFSWMHYRARNHVSHSEKNATDARDQLILKHMAHLMRDYSEQLITTLTSE